MQHEASMLTLYNSWIMLFNHGGTMQLANLAVQAKLIVQTSDYSLCLKRPKGLSCKITGEFLGRDRPIVAMMHA